MEALLGVILGLAGQELVGVIGGLGAAGGAVAWVVRVENDLMAKYRSRVAELTRDLQMAETERDDWRNRYYRLLHFAAVKGLPLQELGLDIPRNPAAPPATPEEPPPLAPPL